MKYKVDQKVVFVENLDDVLLTRTIEDIGVMRNDSIVSGMRGVITQVDRDWVGVEFSERVHNVHAGQFPKGRMGYTWWIKDYILNEAVRVVRKKNNYY